MHFALMAHARLLAMQIDRALEMSGYAVAQLVEALHYKPEGHGFDSR